MRMQYGEHFYLNVISCEPVPERHFEKSVGVNHTPLLVVKHPNCNSIETVKNGRRKEPQSYKCKHCSRLFLVPYQPWHYSDDVKQCVSRCTPLVLKLRDIERVTGIHHTSVMNWVREAGNELAAIPESNEIPEITNLNELQTFVGNKRHKIRYRCQSLAFRYPCLSCA